MNHHPEQQWIATTKIIAAFTPSLSYSGFTVKIVPKPLPLVAMRRVQPVVTCIIPILNPNPNPNLTLTLT